MAKEDQPNEDESNLAADPGDSLRFPRVVLGASAGGLQPLMDFIAAVPAESGMSYLVVQHRTPDSDSVLTDLIGRAAAIPVINAQQDQALEPDRVYVAPPGCLVAIAGGAFMIETAPAKQHLPIDHLLRGLAWEAGVDAFAVILSGTGSDGALGVRAVKAEGGFVAVQDPGTAEYPDMPNAAIETGDADLVLPAAAIPERLIDYARQRHASGLDTDDASRELPHLYTLLRERLGHDFSHYKPNTVLRRVARRMAVHGLRDRGKYLRLLRDDADELNTLFQELLIRVSGFFRDPEAFAALECEVIPKLVQRCGPDRPIRVWVPGCATGEEAYSIAILLDEALAERTDSVSVQIFATDIDAHAIAMARAGRYPHSIAADLSRARLAHYFQSEQNHYRVSDDIRDRVVFAEQSLIKDPPFSSLSLLSCRNLLIYMDLELQKNIYPVFHYALEPGGFLFLGSSESITGSEAMFSTLNRKAKIFERRDNGRPQALPQRPMNMPQPGRSNRVTTPRGEARRPAPIVEVAERMLLRDHVPACVVIDDNNHILYFRGRTGRFLEPATGASSLDITRMVRGELARDLWDVLRRARHDAGPVSGKAIALPDSDDEARVRLRATPLSEAELPRGALLIAFEPVARTSARDHSDVAAPPASGDAATTALEQELQQTRHELRTSIEEAEASNEELQSSNEELQSSNEELQSSNEELETSREELQSVNEELHTLNRELETTIEELSQAHDDITNLLASIEVGIVFLDAEQRIKRFTSGVQRIIPLLDSDLGRPLRHFGNNLVAHDLSSEIDQVLQHGVDYEQALQGRDGRWYLMRSRPYWSGRNRITGAVLAFVDLSGDPELAHMTWIKAAVSRFAGMAALLELPDRIEYTNQAFDDVTGLDVNELSDNSIRAVLPDLTPSDTEAMHACLRAANTWTGEFRCQGPDALNVAATFTPLRGLDDDISHALVYLDRCAPGSAASRQE